MLYKRTIVFIGVFTLLFSVFSTPGCLTKKDEIKENLATGGAIVGDIDSEGDKKGDENNSSPSRAIVYLPDGISFVAAPPNHKGLTSKRATTLKGDTEIIIVPEADITIVGEKSFIINGLANKTYTVLIPNQAKFSFDGKKNKELSISIDAVDPVTKKTTISIYEPLDENDETFQEISYSCTAESLSTITETETITLKNKSGEILATVKPNKNAEISKNMEIQSINKDELPTQIYTYIVLRDSSIDNLAPWIISVSPANKAELEDGTLEVTIKFNEAMDQDKSPLVKIGEHQVYEKSYDDAIWKGTIYIAPDGSMDSEKVNLTVKNAQDLAGNVLFPYSGTYYSIKAGDSVYNDDDDNDDNDDSTGNENDDQPDYTAPTVISFDIQPAPVNFSYNDMTYIVLVKGQKTVTVKFSEEMNTEDKNSVSVTIGDHRVNCESFTDDEWTGTITITEDGVMDNISSPALISGGQDPSGNEMKAYSAGIYSIFCEYGNDIKPNLQAINLPPSNTLYEIGDSFTIVIPFDCFINSGSSPTVKIGDLCADSLLFDNTTRKAWNAVFIIPELSEPEYKGLSIEGARSLTDGKMDEFFDNDYTVVIDIQQ